MHFLIVYLCMMYMSCCNCTCNYLIRTLITIINIIGLVISLLELNILFDIFLLLSFFYFSVKCMITYLLLSCTDISLITLYVARILSNATLCGTYDHLSLQCQCLFSSAYGIDKIISLMHSNTVISLQIY